MENPGTEKLAGLLRESFAEAGLNGTIKECIEAIANGAPFDLCKLARRINAEYGEELKGVKRW